MAILKLFAKHPRIIKEVGYGIAGAFAGEGTLKGIKKIKEKRINTAGRKRIAGKRINCPVKPCNRGAI